jgi:hypothetical protein
VDTLAVVTALAAAVLNAIAAGYGAWRWWRVEVSRAFWVLVRIGQVAAVVFAVVAGIAYVSGARPDDGLFWLYAVLPVVVGFFAEQYRILSARSVLDQRGMEDAKDVGKLPEAEQQSVMLQIIRREMGVMILGAMVSAFLLLRAISVASGL